MKDFIQRKKNVLLFLIVLVGLFLRLYQLGSNPPSLNWDEASTGYNAFSILKTGRDEYGNFLPLSIRSFDDYKPPLYTYIDVPFIAIFGLTDIAVRLPSAILGTLSIILVYFLILEFVAKRKEAQEVALLGAFLFAVSPWSLQFSRAAYEGNIGLFFYLGGILFFLKSFKKNWQIIISTLFLVIGMYSYHSFRLIIPLTLIVFAILFLRELMRNKKFVIISLTIITITSIPIFSSFISSNAGTGSRLSMVTIFGDSQALERSIKRLEYDRATGNVIGEAFDNRRVIFTKLFIEGYLTHFDPNFLFIKGDGGRQHHAVDMGMLYLVALPFILLGSFEFIKNFNKKTILLFALFFIAPIPSAIASGAPHPVRSIAMAPFFDIFAATGLVLVFYFLLKNRFEKLAILFIVLAFFINFIYYSNQYYVHTPREYGDFWQYGYKEVTKVAKSREGRVDSIIITYRYDQPYIYYLYYNKIDPYWYQRNWNFTKTGEMPRFERKIGKYIFKNIEWESDKQIKNALIIGTPEEIPQEVS